jgi:hypothetical protein
MRRAHSAACWRSSLCFGTSILLLSLSLSLYLFISISLSISPSLLFSSLLAIATVSSFLRVPSWQAETLVKDQAAQLLRRCGMADKLQRWNEYKRAYPNATGAGAATGTAAGAAADGTVPPLSSIEGMDAASMAVAFKAFYAAVFALGAMLTPQCERYAKNNAKRGSCFCFGCILEITKTSKYLISPHHLLIHFPLCIARPHISTPMQPIQTCPRSNPQRVQPACAHRRSSRRRAAARVHARLAAPRGECARERIRRVGGGGRGGDRTARAARCGGRARLRRRRRRRRRRRWRRRRMILQSIRGR